MTNCDINVVAVFVDVKVHNQQVSNTEWVIGAQFWDFLFSEHILRSWQTDSPARTLVRLAFKSYQMGLPFSQGSLNLLDGELFVSHKKKVEEMEVKWDAYPYRQYKLESSKKSYRFRKIRAECPYGRKANLKCAVEKCSKCCSKDPVVCKAHKFKQPSLQE